MAEPLVVRCASCGGMNRVREDRLSNQPTCGRCKATLDLEAHPVDVSDDVLDRLVRSSPVPVLVDFWAPWCGPCRAVAPHLVALAKAQAGKLIIAKVNTDMHKRTAGVLNVQAIPTMAVYKGGALKVSEPGARMGAQLRDFVAPYL